MSPAVPRIAAHASVPPWPVLHAPLHWQQVDFISDLHLQIHDTATFTAWKNYMQSTRADAVFILGDLFEVWVGDDIIDAITDDVAAEPDLTSGFEARCVQVLKDASQHQDIFFMHGNRDFLVGTAFARSCGLTLLDDPCVLVLAEQRWLLSHGDALCLDDTAYMAFRAQVRSDAWQRNFLDKPRVERLTLARDLRMQSEKRKRSGMPYPDVSAQATCDWLHMAHAGTLIHGHTHKPADHDLGAGLRRMVLSDWDTTATPPRAEIFRLSVAPDGQGGVNTTTQRISPVEAA